ncbi:MAG: energy-coupling factor transporter transmembrane component T, partial [Candidatus Altiarchaeota archaeon]
SIYNNLTTPDNLLRIIPRRLSHSTLLVAITMRFIPTITADARSIRDAQRCRGLKTSKANIKDNFALIAPTIVNSLERSYNLAEALEARGYSGDRSRYLAEKWGTLDWFAVSVFLSGVAYLVFLRVSGSLAYWSAMAPYAGALNVNPLVLALTLLLVIP